MADAGRLFVGVALSADARAALAANLQESTSGAAVEIPGKVAPGENWHITLRFLGDSSQLQLDTLLFRLGEVDWPSGFTLVLGGLGAFPRPEKATVLWVSVDSGHQVLLAIAPEVEEAAVASGYPPEDRPFHPHLTLSRIRPQRDVTRLVHAVPRMNVKWPVEELTVFRSHLGGGPARYEVVDTVALA